MTSERTVLVQLLRAGITGNTDSIFIPGTIDWRKLIDEADRQGVAVFASDGLEELYKQGLYRANDEKSTRRIKAQWFCKTLNYEQRYIDQLAAAEKLANWMSPLGIQTVVMKGVTVAECYPIPMHRYSSDFDCFLVKDGEHFKAWEEGNKVIESHGLKVGRGFYKNSAFHIDGLYVENHKFCTPCRGNNNLIRLEKLLQQIILDGPLTSLGDTSLKVPPLLFSALFLTEHAYSHFLHEGLNLKHLLDWSMFRHKHSFDLDWSLFDSYCRDFGFTRFVESVDHLGEYILGDREEFELTSVDKRMLASVWGGLLLHPDLDPHSIRAKFAFAGNTIQSAWKYRAYSNISMLKDLWIQVKGFLFIKNPTLK